MAEVRGELRENATYGEKETLRLLKQNLPREFTIYVEVPIHKYRDIRYPDFIILTNYGVIVLEVKDWVFIEHAEPSGAIIRSKNNETHSEPNPVTKAREMAISLSELLNTKNNSDIPGETIPWSYAAILFNLPSSIITQLYLPWGENFVFGKFDLENPKSLLQKLMLTFPMRRIHPLSQFELDMVRAIIYPIVEIEVKDRKPFVLDIQQEKIVAEPVQQDLSKEAKKKSEIENSPQQNYLFDYSESEKSQSQEDELPEIGKRIIQNATVRLVRGFSGSGKTLVLIQRAKYLEAMNPDWKISVLTYNKPLQTELCPSFTSSKIKPQTFHSLCHQFIEIPEKKESIFKNWFEGFNTNFSVLQNLGEEYLIREINWLQDMGVTTLEQYLGLERHGIGKDFRVSAEIRKEIFDLYTNYRDYLRQNTLWDWHEIPLTLLDLLENGKLSPLKFDAILIDESQDWAPVWFKVVNHFLNQDHGLLFLTDDPAQSIYKYFSWKEKSVNVVGRTRWLRVPYRNTYEIYIAAYSMIEENEEIQNSLRTEGELIKPEISKDEMRHGLTPIIRRCMDIADERMKIKAIVDSLINDGYHESQITVLARYKSDIEPISEVLSETDVEVHPIHSFTGLEREVIIIPHLQNTFTRVDEEAAERRLLYMAMSRARSRLYMTYSKRLPKAYYQLRDGKLVDFQG
jgi:hypothetical protein